MEAENRNLIAVVGSAGISTEGLGPTELRAAALKANAFLATEYLTHSMQFALRTARERRKADELVHAWGRDGEAAAAPVEVYSVVRPGQRQSKAQKWLNRTGLDTMTRHHADLHDNPSQILNADIADFKTVETKAHKEMKHGPAYLRYARLSGAEQVKDVVKFDRCMSEAEFAKLLQNKNIVIQGAVFGQRGGEREKHGCFGAAAEGHPESREFVQTGSEREAVGVKGELFYEYVDFAEVPTDLDLLSNDTAPFYSQAVARFATRYFSVPYATFIKVAEAMPDPAPSLLFLWSTGRCGSTLVSQLLHTHVGVTASLSEPPVIASLRGLILPHFVLPSDVSKESHVRSVMRMLFKNWSSKDELVCVKPHPVAIEVVPLIARAMPTVKHCFMYRNSAANIQSWHSLLNRVEGVEEGDRGLPLSYFALVPEHLRIPFAKTDYLNPLVKPKAHLHVFYCAIMHHAINLIEAGYISKTFKYEDVVSKPCSVLAALLEFAGMPFHETPETRAQIFQAMGKDSQLMGETYKPKPSYSFTQDEIQDFAPCHMRFGLLPFSSSGTFDSLGSITLPHSLV